MTGDSSASLAARNVDSSAKVDPCDLLPFILVGKWYKSRAVVERSLYVDTYCAIPTEVSDLVWVLTEAIPSMEFSAVSKRGTKDSS